MTKHFFTEIEKLKRQLLSLSAMVEESLFLAVKAVLERNPSLAATVAENDRAIDLHEVEVEEECLKILALYQPIALDLRFVIAVLKINNDLERIGDLAVNIAHRAKSLSQLPPIQLPFNLPEMSSKVKSMVRKSLESLVHQDPAAAKEVCSLDDEIDEMHASNFQSIKEKLKSDPQQCDALLLFSHISRILERIADHSTNIAEDVYYMVEGEIIRHRALFQP